MGPGPPFPRVLRASKTDEMAQDETVDRVNDLLERLGSKDGMTDELKEKMLAAMKEAKEQFMATQVNG